MHQTLAHLAYSTRCPPVVSETGAGSNIFKFNCREESRIKILKFCFYHTSGIGAKAVVYFCYLTACTLALMVYLVPAY